MKLIISPHSETPIYEQLCRQIISQIISGELKPNSPLPSIRQVSGELKISVITVKNAYEKLENDGFIYALPAKGFYVCPDKSGETTQKLELARKKAEQNAGYYRDLGVKKEEIIKIIEEIY